MAANTNLHKAKTAKNDEFYTQLSDVAEELRHYKEHFRGKTVFCNCDDPTWSAFWKYFHLNFSELGLKKLISTHYDKTEPTYKMEYTGGDDNDIEAGIITPLEDNGDFRNAECIELLKESDIVVTNPPFSCYSDDTEVLTDNGWKLFKDVDIKTDKIISLNPGNNQIETVAAVDKICQPVKEQLYHFTGKNLDFLVTGNHRMYVSHTAIASKNLLKERKEVFVRAEKINNRHMIKTSGFEWTGEKRQFFCLPAVPPSAKAGNQVSGDKKHLLMKDWLEFLGIYITCGRCRVYQNEYRAKEYVVSIKTNNSNDSYILRQIRKLGYTPITSYSDNGDKLYNIYNHQLWYYLKDFKVLNHRFIPREYLTLDREHLRCLLKSCALGITYPYENGISYLKVLSEHLAGDLQELILKAYGQMCSIEQSSEIIDDTSHTVYCIAACLKADINSYARYKNLERVPYTGNVYCLTLERNHIMLVRHNGVIGWCGNCFREYVAQLMEYDKKFLIIGNKNAITYKEFFPLLKENKVWIGYNNVKEFIRPDRTTQKFGNIGWFTNLDIKKRHEKLILWKPFKQEDYPLYDNYNAFNVDKVADIPVDDCFELTVDEATYLRLKETYGDDLEVLEIIEDIENT